MLGKRLSELSQANGTHDFALKAMRTSIDEVMRNTSRREPRFYQDYKIGAAAIAGAMAIILVLALLPGESGFARFTASKIIGGKNPVHAADIIRGGDSFHGKLIFETTALMKTEPFATSYAQCVERAKQARRTFRCTLAFPAISQN